MPTANRSQPDSPELQPVHTGPLLIIGASARQCAQSALRSGIDFVAVDLFGDWDLRQSGPCIRVESFENFDWLEWLSSLPIAPSRFMITGGMEKRSGLIAALAERIPFAGPDPVQIERTNDPFLLAAVCQSLGIQFPEVHAAAEFDGRQAKLDCSSDSNSVWLVKPFHSAGGTGIEFWPPDSVVNGDQSTARERCVQRFVIGRSFSSLFCGDGQSSNLIGSTVQLVGELPFTTRRFNYCGSIGPVHLGSAQQDELSRIGNALVREFKLCGVFGIDWILDADEKIWLIEINPRITASAELFEMAGLQPGITELHLQASAGNSCFSLGSRTTIYGKAILFSNGSEEFVVDQPTFDRLLEQYTPSASPAIADIPCVGTKISLGQPILTMLTTGNSELEVRANLNSLAHVLKSTVLPAKRL